jgi:hypothetical protein
MEEERPDSLEARLPISELGRSLVLIVGGTVALTILFPLVVYVVSRSFFPRAFEYLATMKNVTLEEFFSKQELFPAAFFLSVVGGFAVCCFLVGGIVARMAPRTAWGHTVFLAVIVGLIMLQNMLGGGRFDWPLILAFAVCPLAVLAGGRLLAGAGR